MEEVRNVLENFEEECKFYFPFGNLILGRYRALYPKMILIFSIGLILIWGVLYFLLRRTKKIRRKRKIKKYISFFKSKVHKGIKTKAHKEIKAKAHGGIRKKEHRKRFVEG
jgi:hypothetical protein